MNPYCTESHSIQIPFPGLGKRKWNPSSKIYSQPLLAPELSKYLEAVHSFFFFYKAFKNDVNEKLL